MKLLHKALAVLLLLAMCAGTFAACAPDEEWNGTFTVENEYIGANGRMELPLGVSTRLMITSADDIADKVEWSASNGNVTVAADGTVTAVALGKVTVTASLGNFEYKLMITVVDNTTMTLTADKYYIPVGEVATLSTVISPEIPGLSIGFVATDISPDNPYFELEDGTVKALRAGGTTEVYAYAIGTNLKSNTITIHTVASGLMPPESIYLSTTKSSLYIGESTTLRFTTTPHDSAQNVVFNVTRGADVVSVRGNELTALKAGTATVVAVIDGVRSNELTVSVKPSSVDPYENMTSAEFYASYTPASSYMDAYYRSQHYFMSGDIVTPEAAPKISPYRPTENGKFVRNSESYFSDSGNTYNVIDAYGNEVMEIYRSGSYITLEEVAAYVFAFGTIPTNYTENKNADPKDSAWGEYLRCNNTSFSGSTTKYPYEPELPNISGCGGSLQYREIDIGTTGTDTGGGYAVKTYNDGNTITRGAARIVYARRDLDGDGILERGEHHVFYTYNHYNDFQEYLNYYGGWGEMFGNITGGGTLSSKYDYNPTPYVELTWRVMRKESEAA